MATIEDVVTALTRQTKEGKVEWSVTSWSPNYDRPNIWQTQINDCSFALYRSHLSMHRVGHGWHVIGRDNEVSELVVEVDSFPADGKHIVDEYLQVALTCLTEKS